MSSLFTSYGEYYTKVFYISLCLNGRAREETFKHPIFRFEKGSQSNAKLPLKPNNTTKIRTIFVITNFIHLFSFSYGDNHYSIKNLKIIWIVNYSLYLCIRKQTIKPYV